MIDLKQFCSVEPRRTTLLQPWSGGEYTYASNGHILVRVKRVDGVDTEQPKMTDMVESWLAKAPTEPMVPMPVVELPDIEWVDCLSCEGNGVAHPDCQTCNCLCEDCEGKGKLEGARHLVRYGDDYFNAKYWRMIMGLRDPYIATAVNSLKHFHFTFYIGHGIVMPLHKEMVPPSEKRTATVIEIPKKSAA